MTRRSLLEFSLVAGPARSPLPPSLHRNGNKNATANEVEYPNSVRCWPDQLLPFLVDTNGRYGCPLRAEHSSTRNPMFGTCVQREAVASCAPLEPLMQKL
jgi:hypothetical protein